MEKNTMNNLEKFLKTNFSGTEPIFTALQTLFDEMTKTGDCDTTFDHGPYSILVTDHSFELAIFNDDGDIIDEIWFSRNN